MNLVERAELTQLTVDRWLGVPFAWGAADCSRLIGFHLKAFGHRPPLAKAGTYKTALGAQAALRRLGCETLIEAVDGIGSLMRLDAPAFAMPGDVMTLPGDDCVLSAMVIYLGNGAALGWHGDAEECVIMNSVTGVEGAWRV
jgi:hypothetical protein